MWIVRAMLLTLLGWGCGCRHGDDRGRRERTVAIATCADAVEKAGTLGAGDQIEALARGCTAACPGLADWLTAPAAGQAEGAARGALPESARAPRTPLVALVAGCVRDCDAEIATAGVPPAMRWPALIEACGEAPGVPGDQPGLGSEPWLVLHVVATWIERSMRAGVADRQVPGRVEQVTGRSTFALPPPAHPSLPTARFRRLPRARQFVVIGAELRMGVVAHARLRGGRVELVPVPGGHPGQRVEADQLAAVLVQHAELLAQLDATPAVAPLVIADRATPLVRLIDVVTRLGVASVEIAVDGDVSFAHPVLLERQTPLDVGTPELQLGPTSITIRGFGDDRVTDWKGLPSELDHFAAVNAPVRALELHAHPSATVTDLVRVLDASLDARVSALLFVPRALP